MNNITSVSNCISTQTNIYCKPPLLASFQQVITQILKELKPEQPPVPSINSLIRLEQQVKHQMPPFVFNKNQKQTCRMREQHKQSISRRTLTNSRMLKRLNKTALSVVFKTSLQNVKLFVQRIKRREPGESTELASKGEVIVIFAWNAQRRELPRWN